MNNFVRDIIGTLSYETSGDPIANVAGDRQSLLDRRIADITPGSGGGSRTVLKIRAGDCQVWDGNPRDTLRLSSANCRTLIESIAAEGSNRIPVLVRPAAGNAGAPYELLVGSRRRFSVDWLNHNGRPDILLNALVVDMSDEEAFRLADLENREREDISELDRARSYQTAVDRFYAGVQSRMAKALGLSNSQLSRLLSLAQLPDAVVDAFPTREDLCVRHSEVLTPILRRPELRHLVEQEALRVGAEQQQRATAGEKMIQPATVLARLKAVALHDDAALHVPDAILWEGQKIGQIRSSRDGAVVLELSLSLEADIPAILDQARAQILVLRAQTRASEDDPFEIS